MREHSPGWGSSSSYSSNNSTDDLKLPEHKSCGSLVSPQNVSSLLSPSLEKFNFGKEVPLGGKPPRGNSLPTLPPCLPLRRYNGNKSRSEIENIIRLDNKNNADDKSWQNKMECIETHAANLCRSLNMSYPTIELYSEGQGLSPFSTTTSAPVPTPTSISSSSANLNPVSILTPLDPSTPSVSAASSTPICPTISLLL